MKLIISFIILFFSLGVYSQPGCVREEYIRNNFLSISDSIEKNPSNLNLRWERIKLTQTPTCDKFIFLNSDQDSLVEFKEVLGIVGSDVASYKLNLVKELSLLIDNSVVYENEFEHYNKNKYDYYYLRGQEYLYQKDTINALSDFHKALETSNKYLKINIVKTLSDYYYNSNSYYNNYRKNNKKALYYIDLVSPIEFLDTLSGQEYDPFISEKIRLLKYLKDDSRLEKYLLKIIQHTYLSIPAYDKFQINNQKEALLDKINDLGYFYFEKQEYNKAKKIIELVLKYKPDESNYYVYNDNYRWASKYYLLNRIYQTDEFNNKNLELDFLLKGLYADPLFNDFNLGTKYLENLLKSYSEDPRVYISWIYIKLMDEHLRKNYSIEINYPMTISELFYRVEYLNYKGFELSYLKAVYYLNTKKYSQALNEINQALEIKNDSKLIMLKAQILKEILLKAEREKQIDNPDYEMIEKMRKAIRKDYFQYENLSELVNKINEIASH